jgi:hypothetical protein
VIQSITVYVEASGKSRSKRSSNCTPSPVLPARCPRLHPLRDARRPRHSGRDRRPGIRRSTHGAHAARVATGRTRPLARTGPTPWAVTRAAAEARRRSPSEPSRPGVRSIARSPSPPEPAEPPRSPPRQTAPRAAPPPFASRSRSQAGKPFRQSYEVHVASVCGPNHERWIRRSATGRAGRRRASAAARARVGHVPPDGASVPRRTSRYPSNGLYCGVSGLRPSVYGDCQVVQVPLGHPTEPCNSGPESAFGKLCVG